MARSLLVPDDGVALISRAELLSLRTPASRGLLMTRFHALRKALREMGFDPETLDHFVWEGRRLTLAEKVYPMLLLYCGLNHEQALAALLTSCGVELDVAGVRRRASHLARSADRTFVGAAMKMLLRDAERTMDLTPERTLEEIYRIAMGSIVDVAEWTDDSFTMKDLSKLPRSAAAIISSVKRTTGRDGSVSWEVKLHDKVRALELLSKYFGLLVEKVEVTVDQSIGDRIDRARRRVLEGELVPAALLEAPAPDFDAPDSGSDL